MTSSPVFSSPRTFQLWLFTTGHRTLLLRSVKGPDAPTRIDLLFKPVRYVQVPTELRGVEIHLSERGEAPSNVQASSDDDDLVYRVDTGNVNGWIVAGSFQSHEDAGEYGDDSYFDVPNVGVRLGRRTFVGLFGQYGFGVVGGAIEDA